MALATLCQRLQTQKPNQYYFEAFVVDHRARSNSTAEAKQVAAYLENLGQFIHIGIRQKLIFEFIQV